MSTTSPNKFTDPNERMMILTIRESALLIGQEYDDSSLKEGQIIPRTYSINDIYEFKKDLIDTGYNIRIIYLENSMPMEEFTTLIHELEIPIVVLEIRGDRFYPAILSQTKKGLKILRINDYKCEWEDFEDYDCKDFLTDKSGNVMFLGVFSYKSLVSEDQTEEEGEIEKLTPIQRFIRLLSGERKDIVTILIYAIFIGIIGLSLPLGIQATVELVSGGVVVSSVYILIALVIIGVLAAGGLQVMQISVVEYLQRRIFTKAALEFAIRVPRVKMESIMQHYAPELMNRFFDVLTIQKGLPKLLIDITTSLVQILFGLLLLSFYHPFFVFFGLLLVSILTLIFYLTGPKGLRSSINESKYKYKVVAWLEELARTLNSFKISGNTSLPISKTEYNVNNYLKNRKIHFKVLISQYSWIILFKAVVTGGLLIIGTALVIQREITLGQFVASEVIIILILSSVEKIILYMEVVYDLLTAVDKISHVTDIPLERSGGIDFPYNKEKKGFQVVLKNLNYKYQNHKEYTLKDLNLNIESGEKICISGGSESGKTTLTNVITGLHQNFEGIITFNGLSIRDVDLRNLRDNIGKNVSREDIFDGTVLENILVGKPFAAQDKAIKAIEKAGISDEINSMPKGLNTHILSEGQGLSSSFINKLILARVFAKEPRMIILNDFFESFSKSDKIKLMDSLIANENLSMLAVSNDPLIMASCDRVIVLEHGKIVREGKFESIMKYKEVAELC